MHEVAIENGRLAEGIAEEGRFDKVLELVGTTTLLDSLACLAPRGMVCMAGMVGDRWTIDHFEPMVAIPSKARLTIYSGGTADFKATPLDELLTRVSQRSLSISIGRSFRWKTSLRRID